MYLHEPFGQERECALLSGRIAHMPLRHINAITCLRDSVSGTKTFATKTTAPEKLVQGRVYTPAYPQPQYVF